MDTAHAPWLLATVRPGPSPAGRRIALQQQVVDDVLRLRRQRVGAGLGQPSLRLRGLHQLKETLQLGDGLVEVVLCRAPVVE